MAIATQPCLSECPGSASLYFSKYDNLVAATSGVIAAGLSFEQGDAVEMLKRGWGQRLIETDLDVA